jgi:diguanylate cyclase (GGDEF)-like protein
MSAEEIEGVTPVLAAFRSPTSATPRFHGARDHPRGASRPPLSQVLLDIDRFKDVNDRYGHLAGDRVLKGIASVVAREVRRDELLARYGGEEFAVVLPETTEGAAALCCERIRSDIESETFDYDGAALRATISLGAAALETSDSVDSLVARADRRLYRAKQDGRTAWWRRGEGGLQRRSRPGVRRLAAAFGEGWRDRSESGSKLPHSKALRAEADSNHRDPGGYRSACRRRGKKVAGGCVGRRHHRIRTRINPAPRQVPDFDP